jgi:2-polyprenyl-3-methyl-5-hydroxy-6-metoxy-1,4-benzoquinol methylase
MLISRCCPICRGNQFQELVSFPYERLFKLNETLNKEWFNRTTIESSMVVPIVICNACNFKFSKYALNKHLQFEYYHQAINEEKSKIKIFKRQKRAQLIKIWSDLHSLSDNSIDNIKVLDYGAGWGDFLAVAKSPGVEVFGLEFDERKIHYASSIGIQLRDYVFIEANAPYDIFMCNQVLEHLENPLQALKDLRVLLSKDAVGYISVPNFSMERMEHEIALIKSGSDFSKDVDPIGHLNYFAPQDLINILQLTGFEIIQRPLNTKMNNLTFELYFKKISRFISMKSTLKNEHNTTSFYVYAK